jgi:hypothetical protein
MVDKMCFFTYPNLSRAWLALEAVRLIVFAADKLEQFCCERKKNYTLIDKSEHSANCFISTAATDSSAVPSSGFYCARFKAAARSYKARMIQSFSASAISFSCYSVVSLIYII